jgi:hypothetical protein
VDRGSQDESGKVEEPAQVLNTRCSDRGYEQGPGHGRYGKTNAGLDDTKTICAYERNETTMAERGTC